MNQEQELREIRNRWDVDDFVIDDKGQSDILTLLEAIDQRDAIIHDLQLDGSPLAQRAVEEFAAGVVELLEKKKAAAAAGTTWTETGRWTAFGQSIAIIEERAARQATPDPLPPDQVRQECERLRAKLRAIAEKAESMAIQLSDQPTRISDARTAIRAAEALHAADLNILMNMASEDTP